MHLDEALDETNAAVPSDSADDARIGSNCSAELEPLRTSASNSGSWELNLGKPFRALERARRGEVVCVCIYIYGSNKMEIQFKFGF
jgi:hypothetical protein